MENIEKNNDAIDNFLSQPEEVCDTETGVCYINNPDGLIERRLIEKKLVVKDGRELLKEEMLVSNSNKTYLR